MKKFQSLKSKVRSRGFRGGWTLVELLVVILIIGILVAFTVPRFIYRMTTRAKVVTARQQMQEFKVALKGDPTLVSDGEMISGGYFGDVGAWPPAAPGDPNGFKWLYTQPPGVSLWDPYTKHGWHGPYIRVASDTLSRDIDLDPWDNPYRYILDSNTNPIGLESAGPDGLFVGPPAGAEDDNIRVMF